MLLLLRLSFLELLMFLATALHDASDELALLAVWWMGFLIQVFQPLLYIRLLPSNVGSSLDLLWALAPLFVRRLFGSTEAVALVAWRDARVSVGV